MPEISATIRAEVRSRARGRCEYCRIPALLTFLRHEVDHVVAAKHGGESAAGNLALCRALCNKRKGADLASIDPETGEMHRLFHSRKDRAPFS